MVQTGRTVTSTKGLLLASLTLLLSACASAEPELKKQLDEVNRKLVTAENDNARLELRLASVEDQVERLAARPQRPETGSSRPPLKVIRLAPEHTEEPSAGPVADAPDSGNVPQQSPEHRSQELPAEEPRPVIHIDGDQVLQAGGEETKRPPKSEPKQKWKQKRGGA